MHPTTYFDTSDGMNASLDNAAVNAASEQVATHQTEIKTIAYTLLFSTAVVFTRQHNKHARQKGQKNPFYNSCIFYTLINVLNFLLPVFRRESYLQIK
jgi:hypothetical protein